jgi:hypothetical protein
MEQDNPQNAAQVENIIQSKRKVSAVAPTATQMNKKIIQNNG